MINKTFRLFISSTFRDFTKEREILNNQIQKKVNDFCQSQGYFFQLVDLRWGVNTESALMQNTLSICLEEVRRCKELSPKPNFLLMVGERYGWIPLPQKILQGDFESILSVSTEEEKELLLRWYRLDENACSCAYFLKPRSGEYIDEDQWFETENRLRNILVRNGKKCGLSSPEMMELTTSATEREIMEGLLDNPGICDNVIAVFRTGYSLQDANQADVSELRKKIRNRMHADGLGDNLAELVYDSNHDAYAAQFEAVVYAKLEHCIKQEIQRIEATEHKNADQHILPAILNSCGEAYAPRHDLVRRIRNYVNGSSNEPLFLTGESGSGKSALLADYLIHSDLQSFYVFFGYGEHSYQLHSAISHLYASVEGRYARAGVPEQRLRGAGKKLLAALNGVPAEKKALFVIDGLDSFYDLDEIHENLFPSKLPPNVKLIVSSASDAVTNRFRESNAQTLAIEHFSPAESQSLLEKYLSCRGRRIANEKQSTCIRRVLANGATPLQIKLLSALCSQWKSDEFDVFLTDTSEASALQYIHTMFTHYGHIEHLVLYALALIVVSPAGITEDMLIKLLLGFSSVQRDFVQEDRHHHTLDKLPFAVWSRLFYDFRDGVELALSGGSIVVRPRHSIFTNVMLREYPEHCAEARNKLIWYYSGQPHFLSEGIPNHLKIQTYPMLLKSSGQHQLLHTLLTDLAYIDATAKAGLLDETIENLMYAIGNIPIPEGSDISSILSCLNRYHGRLSCYRGDFLACAYDSGLTEKYTPILSCKDKRMQSRLSFSYTTQSSMVWDKHGKQYAAFCGTEIFLCNAVPYLERVYINVEVDMPSCGAMIHSVLWLENNLIAVLIDNGEMLIYRYQNNSPCLFDRFLIDAKKLNVQYIPALDMLVYILDHSIYARNIQTGNVAYRIPLKSKQGVAFDINAERNELTVLQGLSWIEEYTLSSGEKRYARKAKFPKIRALFFLGRSDLKLFIKKLASNRWFVHFPQEAWYAVVDNGNVSYLQVPSVRGSQKLNLDLPGNRFHIVVWENLLLSIDFSDNFRLRFYPQINISGTAWVKKDECLSVMTDQGLSLVSMDDFEDLDEEGGGCFWSVVDLKHTLLSAGDHLDRNTKEGRLVLKTAHMLLSSNHMMYLSYDMLFRLDAGKGNVVNNGTLADNRATIAAFSNDGKKAVAYEGINTITVYDAMDNPLIVIDKLQLAVYDNILKICFSPDSKCLLIWRNHSIVAINVTSGEYMLKLSISRCPALDVSFTEDSRLVIMLCNQEKYILTCTAASHAFKCQHTLPDSLTDIVDMDRYFGPYYVYPRSGRLKPIPLLGADSFNNLPQLNLRTICSYRGLKHWLLFLNGEFYLDGKTDFAFAHPYSDFYACYEKEYRSETSPLHGYLREKNDLMSVLFEPDERHLVLVCRRLNTVLVFDMDKDCVSAAYKVEGNIIGVKSFSKNRIELVRDVFPIYMAIDLLLP